MQSCGGSQGHVMGPCPCGLYHTQTSSFDMLFSMPNHQSYEYDHSDESDMHNSFTSSSSVDCTLSLGTPSTRFTQDEQERRNRHERPRNSVSNFCLDLLQSHSNSNTSTNDALLARRCANCDTTSTPLWRNGPRGPKSLCNACGIRFKKEERRASAAAANTRVVSGGVMDSQQMYNHSWYPHSQSQRMPCYSPGMGNEYRFVDDGDGEADNGIPYLSWRLNVTDTPSLVHDYTR